MAKKSESLELIETLICKDVTELPNGTYTLTGLYPKDIALVSFPQKLSFALWLNFFTTPKDAIDLEIKISSESAVGDDIIVPVTINENTELKSATAVPVIIKNIVIDVQDEDEVEVSYRLAKKKWKIARVFNFCKATHVTLN